METRLKLALKIIICIWLILLSAGCWNRRELIKLSIVLGVAIDKGQEYGKIELTTQIVKPSELKSGKGKGGSSPVSDAYWNAKAEGDTVFETIRALTQKVDRKLYFPHNQVIILGRELAEAGVQEHVDIFLRDHEPRMRMWILVADGRAAEILSTRSGLEKVPAMNVSQLVESQVATSYSTSVRLDQFATRLMSKTTAPIAPLVRVSEEENENNVVIDGIAVFKEAKLVGELSKQETRGLLWVINEIKSGIIKVDCPIDSGIVDLEIVHAKSKITPQLNDGEIKIKIDLKEQGTIGSQSCLDNLLKPPIIAALEEEKAAAIESEVRAAINKAKELNADVFGFGDVIHRKYPKEWKQLEKNWDDIFPEIEVELKIDAKLGSSGTISKPASPEQE